MLNLPELEARLVALGNHEHDANAAEAFLSRLDNLKPQDSISTNEFDRTKRRLVNPGGEPFDYDENLTPYTAAIGDACDHIDVRTIAVKGNTRSSKTTKAESMLLRDWTFGPLRNVGWIMQDEDSLKRYIDERGEEMLRIHEEVNEKVDWTDPRNGRFFKQIGRAKLFYLVATLRSLRGFAAPILVADEIDAYVKAVRDAIMTLLRSRQEEFGSSAKAYICSHPDAGPDGGIDAILADSLLHLWFVRCPHCGNASTPAAEADAIGAPRMTWNVPELLARAEDMERVAFLDMVAREVVLVCPHDGCHATFTPEQRNQLMGGGTWLQPHQTLMPDLTVAGDTRVAATMGFVIHAFMAPFVDLRETARDWASAMMRFEQTGLDTHLREVTVKKLGETFRGARDEDQVENWRIVQGRIQTPYALKTVPAGVKFLTAFVDVQGDRFEVRVIGWDLGKQSWLIDAYAIKQWPAFGSRGAFDNIDPANRLGDWDVVEEAVLMSSYPLSSNPQRAEAGLPELFLPIAKTVVNSAGSPGVTNMARIWAANIQRGATASKRIIPAYRVTLMQGSASKKGEVYGRPKQVQFDDRGRPLAIPVMERYPNVYEIKRIIARRMKIGEPGPGMMHMPMQISPRYYRELTAENLVNGDWIRHGANETWDGWVAAELARETLKPDRPELWSMGELPEWADPRPRDQVAIAIDGGIAPPVSIFDRLRDVNDDV